MRLAVACLMFVGGAVASLAAPTPEQATTKADAKQPAAPKSAKTPAKPEALFTGWTKPRLVLVATGMLEGHIEPCGCTGLTNQKGGFMRRHTLFKQLQKDLGCEVVGVDVGQLVHRVGRQAEIKYQRMVDGLKKMNYQAAAFGPGDLKLSTGELYSAVAGDDQPGPFVSANVALFDFDEKLLPTFRVIEKAGMKIGFTSVLSDSRQRGITGGDVKFKPAADALAAVVPKLRSAKCDLLVLLAHASMQETKALAQKFPDFHIVVTAGGAAEPPRQVEKLPSGALLVETGQKGTSVSALGVFAGTGAARFRYQVVPLDSRYEDSPEMVKLMATYQDQLRSLWEQGFESYGIRPLADQNGRKYVGSKTCGECHTKAYEIWEKTPHAHATDSLVKPPERASIARHFDAECVSCHATGWEPQEFLPYASGFTSLKATAHLTGSGCENCHGPGSNHVALENDGDARADAVTKARQEMRLPLARARQTCLRCHDLDNSPDFSKPGAFETYWKKVEHKGKD
ncbi:MAG: multiheme c-type cytochrome [Pirellulales bacterium]